MPVLWSFTDVEVASGVARLQRDGALDPGVAPAVLADLELLWSSAHVVPATEAVKPRAFRALRVHARLAEAALREGFRVLPAAG